MDCMDPDVSLEPLDVNNWLKVCRRSVSEEQKAVFTVPNVYWIGISRYEELPEKCRQYVEFIEKEIDCPLTMLSNGPKRDEIIYRKER